MTLTDVLIAYEGLKERSKLNAMPVVDLLVSQLNEKDLQANQHKSQDTPIKDSLRVSLLMPYMPVHELLQHKAKQNKATGYVPVPGLSGATARGILKALAENKLTKAWPTFGAHYYALEATARKE